MYLSTFSILFSLACGPKVAPVAPAPVKVNFPQVTCEEGTEQVGAPPPEGFKLWCRQRQANGQWQPQGAVMEWYKSGEKKVSGSFVIGKKEGEWSTWYESGAVERVESFVNHRAEGPSVEWWENGTKKAEGQKTTGYESGDWEYWHDNGVIYKRGAWLDSRPDGRWVEYDRAGEPTEIRQYAFGRMLSHTVVSDSVKELIHRD